jgi:drug/metabolite transporter (DMT)-like permease
LRKKNLFSRIQIQPERQYVTNNLGSTSNHLQNSTPYFRWIGWVSVLASTVLFSITAPLARAGIRLGMYPTTLTAARFSFGWVLLGLTLPFTRSKRSARSQAIDQRGLWFCLLAGLASGGASVAYFWAISRTNASITSMLVSLYPLIVLVFLALRAEKLTMVSLARLALGIGGVYVLLGPGGSVDSLGIILSLLTALIFAIQLVITQWYLTKYPSMVVAYHITGVTALVAMGTWLVQGAPWANPGWRGWLIMLILAFFCAYLSRLAMIRGIQELGSAQVALLAPAETMLTVIWSVLFLQERLSVLQWVACALIISSALLAVFNPRILHFGGH